MRKLEIPSLAHWLKLTEDPKIELSIEGDLKGVDINQFIDSDDFKKQIFESCHWVRFYFMIHLEKQKHFFVNGYKIKIHRAFPNYATEKNENQSLNNDKKQMNLQLTGN